MNRFAVIFDMDGVLINSTAINRESFDAVLAKHDLSMDEVVKRSGKDHKGGSLRDLLATIQQEFSISFDLDDFSAQAGEYQFRRLNQIPPNRDLVRLLNDLRSHQVPVAVATSSLKWRAVRILEALNVSEYFEVVVTADDVKEHKPNPHLFLEAARRIDAEPIQCVVIEDADSGVEAGKRANMAVIGFEQFNLVKARLQGQI